MMRSPDAPADPQLDSVINRQIGPYRLVSPIAGQGETPRLYKAVHVELNRGALVRLLPAAGPADPADAVLKREVQALAALHHPHIAAVYDFGRYEAGYYLAMEYLPGPDLAQVIAQNHPVSRAQIQAVMADVAAALDCAHAHGILHRNLSPSRILFADDHRAILTDFDLAPPANQGTATADHRLDAPYYLAPEQAISADSIGPAGDIYALGAILFELLAGTPPYVADSPLGVALKHVNAPIPNVCDFAPGTPEAVAAVVKQAMAKDPAQRFATATQMAQALAQAWAAPEGSFVLSESVLALTEGIYPNHQPTTATPAYTRAASPPAPAGASNGRARFWWGLAAVLILLILSAGVWGFLRRPKLPVTPTLTDMAAELPAPTGTLAPTFTPSATVTPVLRQSESDSISLIVVSTPPAHLETASTPERIMVTETPVVVPTLTPLPTDALAVLPTTTALVPAISPVITYTPTTEELLAGLRGKILFKTDRSGRVEIFQMNADGSNQLPLDPERAYLYNEVVRWETFSPDRQETIVVRGEGQLDLWRISIAGGNETRITSDGAADYDPVWAPGNNRLAFVSDRTGNGDVYLLNLDGSGETRLTLNEGDFDKHPSWSPAGDQLVFWSDRGVNKYWQIWLFDLKTGQSANLSNNTFRDWDPVWVK